MFFHFIESVEISHSFSSKTSSNIVTPRRIFLLLYLDKGCYCWFCISIVRLPKKVQFKDMVDKIVTNLVVWKVSWRDVDHIHLLVKLNIPSFGSYSTHKDNRLKRVTLFTPDNIWHNIHQSSIFCRVFHQNTKQTHWWISAHKSTKTYIKSDDLLHRVTQ